MELQQFIVQFLHSFLAVEDIAFHIGEGVYHFEPFFGPFLYPAGTDGRGHLAYKLCFFCLKQGKLLLGLVYL